MGIPTDFLQAECVVDSHKHAVFYAPHALDELRPTKTAYLDATFKVCSNPIKQLLTLNVFTTSPTGEQKQHPQVTVLFLNIFNV